ETLRRAVLNDQNGVDVRKGGHRRGGARKGGRNGFGRRRIDGRIENGYLGVREGDLGLAVSSRRYSREVQNSVETGQRREIHGNGVGRRQRHVGRSTPLRHQIHFRHLDLE